MAELIPTASEAEWLAARRKGVTASEIAVIMGLSPYSSPYALYHQKLGLLPPPEDNAMMERGRVLEPYVVAKFAEMHPEFVIEGDGRQLYRHRAAPWQLATPDRRLYRPDPDDSLFWLFDGVLETKTASSMDDWGEPGTSDIPVHYRAQVLWQCDVMSCARWKVAVLDVPRWQVHVYQGDLDDDPGATADLELMRHEALLFLKRMENGDVPGADWRPATIGALKALHPSVEDSGIFVSSQLATRYRAAVKNHKHWEQRKKLYEAQLRQQMGSNRRAHVRSEDIPAGEVIARRDVYEVKAHERKASVTDKLVPVYPKAKKES